MDKTQWDALLRAEKLLPTIEEFPTMSADECRDRMNQYKAAIKGLPRTLKARSVTRICPS